MMDVPDDIQAAAEAVVAEMCKLHEYAARPAWVNVAAKALMAERERCAKIAERADIECNSVHLKLGNALASAIRRGTP